jgi:hypothetical protein
VPLFSGPNTQTHPAIGVCLLAILHSRVCAYSHTIESHICSLSDDQNHIYRTCNPFVYHGIQQSLMSIKKRRCAVVSDKTPEQHFLANVQVVIAMIQASRSQYIPWSAAAVAVASVAPPA